MHTILVTGGSLGSHAINVLIEKNLSNILEVSRIIHQTGDARRYKDFERLEEIKKGLPENLKERYQIEKHFDPGEFGQLLKNADIIVARAGINTVSEIIFLEKPALFIPLPFSQRQEQEKNAGFARELGIAEILEDQHNQNEFLQILLKMIKNIKDYKVKKQDNISIDATEKIIEIIKSVKK
jgi:UDP-N-acetylglucosamine--N-acetylmuramyl-(pentapeptide) pyrophosphoryl-undecaprenol N-acetylglucosamine transferase